MLKPVIEVKNLSKRFRVYDRPIDRLKEWITPLGMSYHWAYWALKDINFEIEKGSAYGIVGANGAGKSTLLKMLCGTLSPTYGSVEINGRITGLLELGSGFHPEFSGRQNIYLNARLMGMSDDEINERLPKIIEFAELGDFVDHPIRIYSTGMALRLGFSVAANVDPDILIIDEALAVGDAYFQQKCLKHLRDFREKGGTLLFVSHDPGAVKLLCDHAILLNEGEMVGKGDPEDILNYYNQLVARHAVDKKAYIVEKKYKNSIKKPQHSGSFEALLTDIDMQVDGKTTRTVISGTKATIKITVTSLSNIKEPTVGISLRDRLGYEVYGSNTMLLKQTLPDLKPGNALTVDFSMPMNIGAGDYTVTAAIHSGIDHLDECYDWADKFMVCKVLPSADKDSQGLVRLPVTTDYKIVAGESTDPNELIESLFEGAPSQIVMNEENSRWLFNGWHAIEEIEKANVRWTEQKATFVLMTSKAVEIELNTSQNQLEAGPLEITLMANGQIIGTKTISKIGWQPQKFELPAEYEAKIIRFSLICSKTFVPSEISDSGDKRQLGLIVRRISS